MTTKTQQIINHIAENYQGYKLTGDIVWRIAEEMTVATSTVYRAIKQLADMGTLENKVYVGRQFVHPDEIAKFAAEDGTLLLSIKKIAELAKLFYATPTAIIAGARYGVMSARFHEINGGSYGYMIKVS